MVPVSGDDDPFAPSEPQAPIDREAPIDRGVSTDDREVSIDRETPIDRSEFVARVGPSVDRAHDLAHDIVGDAQVAAEVVREMFESLWARHDELTDDDLRLESILLATRAAALDRRTTRPALADTTTAGADQSSSASRRRVELAQAGAAVLGAGDASALDMHLRHGIDADTLAPTLGVSADDAPQRLARLRSRLDDALAAFTLWRGGGPSCAGLTAALNDGTTVDDGRFDIVAFDVVGAHRATCAECARLHRSIVNPVGMFVAAPVMTVAPSMRDRMLAPVVDASPTTEPLAPVPRRNADDTPTALLWAAADLPARPRAPASAPARPRPVTPIVDARYGDRRVIAGVAAALLLLLTGGAVMAVRSSSGDDNIADATTTTAGPTESTEPEVRALGPVPPVVVTTEATSTTTTTDPTDTSAPETSDPDTSTPETVAAAPVPVTTAPRRSSSTPRPTATTTTTVADVDPGTPPPPPPTATTTTPTTTSPTTTTQTTTAPSTTTTTSTTSTTPTTTTVENTVETTTAPTTTPDTVAP